MPLRPGRDRRKVGWGKGNEMVRRVGREEGREKREGGGREGGRRGKGEGGNRRGKEEGEKHKLWWLSMHWAIM